MLADRRYCYPLTITDFARRYLLTCEGLATTKEPYAFTVFERVGVNQVSDSIWLVSFMHYDLAHDSRKRHSTGGRLPNMGRSDAEARPRSAWGGRLMDFRCVEFVEELLFGEWRRTPLAR